MSPNLIVLFGTVLGGAACLELLVPAERALCSMAAVGAGSDPAQSPRVKEEASQAGDANLRQAEADLNEGRLEEALQACREVLERDPKSAKAYYLLGVIQSQQGHLEKAKEALLQALRLDPSNIASHVYLGRISFETKELPTAAREFQAAIGLRDTSGSGHYGLALVLLANSRYAEALPHLSAAVEAAPKDPQRLFTLIAAELQLKQVAQARKGVGQLEKLSPSDPWLLYRLGRLLEENGLPDQAEAEFERASTNLAEAKGSSAPPDVNLSEFYLQIARVHFLHDDYLETLRYMDKVELGSVEPNLEAPALHMEGVALLAVGNAQEARQKFKEAAQKNPSRPYYLAHWAWAELLAGDARAAKDVVELARNKWPQVSRLREVRAVVERESAPERAGVPFLADWHVKGEGLVCCPCAVPCPCRSNARPTHRHCENTGVFRIAQGYYGNISLNGFTFATVGGSMGPESVLPTFLYVEPATTDEQLIALERLFQSFKPLRPFMFLRVKRVPISFNSSRKEDTYEVEIPGTLQIKVRRKLNARDDPLLSTAALDYFSNVIEYAQNVTYKVWDERGGLSWDYSGRQANFRTIDLDFRNYRDRTMLIQFSDGSGFFNKKQLELIRSLKLPTLSSYPKSK